MTPRCPGGPQYRTANLAKRHAWWIEPNSSKRRVPVQCGDHWHLMACEQTEPETRNR